MKFIDSKALVFLLIWIVFISSSIANDKKNFINEKYASSAFLNKYANDINKNLPVMVNKDTQLFSTAAQEKNFIYVYKLINSTKNQVNLDLDKEFIINGACTLPELKVLIANGVKIDYSYMDKDGVYIGKIPITITKCLARKFIQNKNPNKLKKLLLQLNDKQFNELDIDYRVLQEPYQSIYLDRLGNVEVN